MEDKKISRNLLMSIIFITIIVTIFLSVIISKKTSLLEDNKVIICFVLLIISYSVVSSILIKPFIYLAEKIYIRNNEYNIKEIEYSYYRDIINKYSIGTICHCYGKRINYKDQIVATILKLKLDKKIEIDDNEIKILNEDDLTNSELMIIRSLRGVKVYSEKLIKKQIQEDNIMDCKESDLYYTKDSSIDRLTSFFEITNGIIWVVNFCSIIVLNRIIPVTLLIMLFVCSFILLIPAFLGNYRILVRNKNGIELQRKLIGLKNFLKDYSTIQDKKTEDFVLWDYYIIYAIIFNFKGNLDKDAKNIYVKYFNV